MFSPLYDMLVAKLKDKIWALFFCIPELDLQSGGLKIIERDTDVHALYDLAEKHVEDEAKSPYLRSPPLKSRPLRNDYKGKILLTSMFNHDDEGFDYYPSLYDDELGQDNLVHRDMDNVVNMTGHNMEVDSVEDMNDAAKGVNINEEFASIEGMNGVLENGLMVYLDVHLSERAEWKCMTRSSTKELFTPFKDPEREFRSSRKLLKTLSLDESRSPEFNLFSDLEENSEEKVTEIMTETMEEYMSKTRANYGSGIARPKIDDKDHFELKGQFLKELRDNTFSGSDHEDANEHIEKVIEIVDLFHIPNITQDQIMLRAFPMSLTGAASHWLRNKPSGAIPTKTIADAKVAIQEMDEYSQKWHNGTSKTRSTKTSDGLAAIQGQLNNPGREIKKVNEKERGFRSLPSSTETNPRDHVKSISTTVEADMTPIHCIGSYQYAISAQQNTTRVDDSLPRKEKDPGSFTLPCYINNVCFENALADLGASVSVMPLSTNLNLNLGELAHTKLTIELADRIVKHLKGIAENILVRIGKFIFPVDFIILDMPKDVKVPLILGRPFLSISHAKIDVFKRKITLRVGDEKINFKSVKPASSLIKRVYMLSLRERVELDLKARLMG
ncbi:E3 ubiquitin protein ligase [Tanacetum coccineum]